MAGAYPKHITPKLITLMFATSWETKAASESQSERKGASSWALSLRTEAVLSLCTLLSAMGARPMTADGLRPLHSSVLQRRRRRLATETVLSSVGWLSTVRPCWLFASLSITSVVRRIDTPPSALWKRVLVLAEKSCWSECEIAEKGTALIMTVVNQVTTSGANTFQAWTWDDFVLIANRELNPVTDLVYFLTDTEMQDVTWKTNLIRTSCRSLLLCCKGSCFLLKQHLGKKTSEISPQEACRKRLWYHFSFDTFGLPMCWVPEWNF